MQTTRTSFELPEVLFKHLKTRAAMEGRSMREVVIELLQHGLAGDAHPRSASLRFKARPLIKSATAVPVPPVGTRWTNAALFELTHDDV